MGLCIYGKRQSVHIKICYKLLNLDFFFGGGGDILINLISNNYNII